MNIGILRKSFIFLYLWIYDILIIFHVDVYPEMNWQCMSCVRWNEFLLCIFRYSLLFESNLSLDISLFFFFFKEKRRIINKIKPS